MLIWDAHFLLHFVQFKQFPVLHFGLAHSGSRPFNSLQSHSKFMWKSILITHMLLVFTRTVSQETAREGS